MLLSQYLTFSARPNPPGSEGLNGHERRKQGPNWWSDEDYSLPRRRRPVHNKLDP
ncbi:uncharacterized protein DS421_16g554180 [Arachis hypogaea]|nr:uncharacterized protein DS421_16g554180 [Arachis hypogaea]